MAAEDPYRHPGGRTCAGAAVMLLTAMAGFGFGTFWAVFH